MSDPRTERGQQQWQDMVAESRERQDPLVRRSEATAIATEIVRRALDAGLEAAERTAFVDTQGPACMGYRAALATLDEPAAALTPTQAARYDCPHCCGDRRYPDHTQAAEPAASETVMLWRAWQDCENALCIESVNEPSIGFNGFVEAEGDCHFNHALDGQKRSVIEWIGPGPDPRQASERQAAAGARPEVVAWRYNNRGGLQHFSPSRPSGWPVTEALVLASAATAAIEAAELRAIKAETDALAFGAMHDAAEATVAKLEAELAECRDKTLCEVVHALTANGWRTVQAEVEAMRGRKGQ